MGLMARRAGSVRFDGQDILALPAHARYHLGLAYVPEERRIVPGLSVRENLRLGLLAGPRQGRTRAREAERIDEIAGTFPRLAERLDQEGASLSGGEQQMLAIGRALMSRPSVLLLDEPSLGLAPLVVRQIFGAIRELNRTTGLTVLLVEQNAYQALRLANRGYVLVNGSITMAGTGSELLARPEIRAAYLEGGGA
jgi:branched-chain amino acid transport system ATP-binding protein